MAAKKNLPGPRDVKIDISYLFCHSPFIVHHLSPVVHVVCSKLLLVELKIRKNRKNVAQETSTLMSLGPLFATRRLSSIVLVLVLFVVVVLRWWDRWESMRRVVMGKEFEIIL